MAHKKYKCQTCGTEFDEPPPEKNNECIASYYHQIYLCNELGGIKPNSRRIKRQILSGNETK